MRIFLLLLTLWIPILHAEPFRGPLSSALAGTGRAGLGGAEAGLLNPALVPLLRTYEFDAYYRDGAVEEDQHRNSWGLGAGDNGPDILFPGTLHYIKTRDTGRVPTGANGEFIHAAIGHRLLENVTVGASVYRLNYKVQNDREYTQWNYSLGALWILNPEMGIAYVLNNLAKPGSDVPTGLREDLQQGAGVYMNLGDIARVRLDVTRNEVRNPGQKMVYMASFESLSGEWVEVRAGFRRDAQIERDFLTAGLGFNGPRLKFDYSFEKQLERTSGVLHSVDLRLPF